MAALNPTAALNLASSFKSHPRLSLRQSYFLYLRDEPSAKEITIANIGDDVADVTITAFDDQVNISPKTFRLPAQPRVASSQIVQVSFKREPCIRQIYKFNVIARQRDTIVDETEFYVEYIPKR
jgi:hypothetical protein